MRFFFVSSVKVFSLLVNTFTKYIFFLNASDFVKFMCKHNPLNHLCSTSYLMMLTYNFTNKKVCWKEYVSDIPFAHISICLWIWWQICWNISFSTFSNSFSFLPFPSRFRAFRLLSCNQAWLADMHLHCAGFFVFGYFLFLFSQMEQNSISILEILKQSNSYLPHVLIASILLALIYPRSLTWFTSRSVDALMNW